jgi:hypothetical protein
MKPSVKKFSYWAAGTIIMIGFFGCCKINFFHYSSKDDMINISMDYISGWQYEETRGAYGSYAQALFFPKEKSKALINLTVQDDSKINVVPATLDNVVRDLITKRMLFRQTKILSKTRLKILNSNAAAIELSYLVPENRRSVNSRDILLKEKVIIVEKNHKFYFLSYANSAKDFAKFSSAFMRIARSMKLKTTD